MNNDDIPGPFDFGDLYDHILSKLEHASIFVEVGSLIGKSLHYMASRSQEVGKKIWLIAVDLWPDEYAGIRDSYSLFLSNLRDYPLVCAIRMDSQEAADLFDDGTISAVFIDADHTYEGARNDILAWLPKVENGGILAGHDFLDHFPGVQKAVRELVPDFRIMGASCWITEVKK